MRIWYRYRIVAVFIILTMVIGFSSCDGSSDVRTNSGSDIASSTEKIEADLAGIYEEIETGKSAELTCDYSENVRAYIKAKSQANSEPDEDNLTKTHFGAEARLIDEKDTGDYLKQLYAVEVKFIYAAADGKESDFESGYGTEVLVVTDKNDGNKVVDIVESMNGFDDSIRGGAIMPGDLQEMLESDGGSTMPEIK